MLTKNTAVKQGHGAMARGALLLGMLSTGALLLAGCGAQAALSQTPQADPRLLQDALKDSATGHVSLGEIYGQVHDFDRAVAICPYMDTDDVDLALGFAWDGTDALPLDNEARGALLLARDTKVAAIMLAERSALDFCSMDDAAGAGILPETELGFRPSPGAAGETSWSATRP